MKTQITYTRLIVLAGLLALTNGTVSGQSAATTSAGGAMPAETPQNNFERQGEEFDRQAAAFAKQAAVMDDQFQLAQAQENLPKARATEASEGPPGIPRPSGVTVGGGGYGSSSVFLDQNGVVSFLGGGRSGGVTLIIPKEATPAKSLSESEEDLNVMARILEKAIGHDENRAMGIVVRDAIIGNGSGLRNLYIEGYGTLFFLNVNFPLLAPPAETSEPTRAEETNSEWEQTKRELYSPPGTPPGFQERMRVVIGGSDSTEPYDAGRVEELKHDLMAALKNASHIRGLKADEMVTVVVSGRNASLNASLPRESAGSRRVGPPTASNNRNTRMILSARKSDVDASQKGDLDAPGFEKKVSVVVY